MPSRLVTERLEAGEVLLMDGGTGSEVGVCPNDYQIGSAVLSDESHSPGRMAEYAVAWKEAGAQIIGGFCATGPEHIIAMRRVVRGV